MMIKVGNGILIIKKKLSSSSRALLSGYGIMNRP